MSYYDSTGQSDMAFTKPYSERTAQQIDDEVRVLIAKAREMAEKVIEENRDGLIQLAELLLEREVVFTEDVERIFGKRGGKDDSAEKKSEEPKVNPEVAESVEPEANESVEPKVNPEVKADEESKEN
jgi:cell division protease FtsH